jgi:hypothetical protein
MAFSPVSSAEFNICVPTRAYINWYSIWKAFCGDMFATEQQPTRRAESSSYRPVVITSLLYRQGASCHLKRRIESCRKLILLPSYRIAAIAIPRVAKFVLCFRRTSRRLFHLRFSFYEKRVMFCAQSLIWLVSLSVVSTQSSTYLPAYRGHSFIDGALNCGLLTVDCTLNNHVGSGGPCAGWFERTWPIVLSVCVLQCWFWWWFIA